jgi:hypothetical protein
VIVVNRWTLGGLLILGAITLGGCEGLLDADARSMLVPRFVRPASLVEGGERRCL